MPLNIQAIIIADLMGIVILFAIAMGSTWQTHTIFGDNKSIRVIFAVCLISCIIDPLCSIADGKPGLLNCILIYACNTWLYIGNMINAVMWMKLLADRIGRRTPLAIRIVMTTGVTLGSVLLIVNLFTPIIFGVNENNSYSRGKFFAVYFALYLFIFIYGVVFYFAEKKKSGRLRFFPILAFIVPAVIGMVIQATFYGVSTIAPFTTVSLACIFISLQNEFAYRDKLTGLYNRYYFDVFGERIDKETRHKYSFMMLDINDFKKINDTYGHPEGDRALILTAETLDEIIGVNGIAIRYAGDEFIIIYNSHNDEEIENVVSHIHQRLSLISKERNLPYELSVSLGHSKFFVGESSMSDFITKVDRLMYENKQKYHGDI